MTYKDYEKWSPRGASKSDFQHFLQDKTKIAKHYDSNISNGLTHHYKVLAYKEKELNQRALALDAFAQQRAVHD